MLTRGEQGKGLMMGGAEGGVILDRPAKAPLKTSALCPLGVVRDRSVELADALRGRSHGGRVSGRGAACRPVAPGWKPGSAATLSHRAARPLPATRPGS